MTHVPRISCSLLLLSLLCFGVSCSRQSEAQSRKSPLLAALPSEEDADGDGFPNAMEITAASDRASFRKWFTAIAERQFYQPSDAWNVEQRDCAGLVRFAMREALRTHDRLWFQKMGAGYEAIAPDVQAVRLERSLLGEKLFRVDFGAYKKSDLPDNKFSEFADARTLKNYNATYISRDRAQAEPGDLLFYEQAFAQRFPYHVMIFLGKAHLADESAADWVVYHTGASPDDAGTIKKVRLSVLDQHPDPRWRPVENNKNFLGFYRLKILL